MLQRKKLSDILRQSADADRLRSAWRNTEAAGDFQPLPSGEYVCRVISGEPFNARSGTAGYKLTFQVDGDGEYAGRRLWHDLWLTPAAMAMTKRDLMKLGITDLDQLDKPLPPGILVSVRASVRKSDDGRDYNRVNWFEFAGVEQADAFEPPDDNESNDGTLQGSLTADLPANRLKEARSDGESDGGATQ